jgi:hypothetical protein
MKTIAAITFAMTVASTAIAENFASQTPITMRQLMRELRLQGGNWEFKFDQPVYAKIVCEGYYYREGDPYEVRATICFLASPQDAAKVPRYKRGNPQTFQSVEDE